MTLDVEIGKIVPADYPDDLDHKHLPQTAIEGCPDAEESICNPSFTKWPKEAYRSGGSAFFEFWEISPSLREIYSEMRSDERYEWHTVPLKPLLDRILAVPEGEFEPDEVEKRIMCCDIQEIANLDRLKWLKYWASKAVDLYGEEAGIGFS